MITEYVTVWQLHYGGVHREVNYEDGYHDLTALISECQKTVENHGGVVHLYEIKNDGLLEKINTFGTFQS